MRNLEPIAIFDSAGVIHPVTGTTELMPAHGYIDHKLALTTARVLGHCFP